MAQPVIPNTDQPQDRPSPRIRRARLKRRVRWLLAGGSVATAIGVYVGLAVSLPVSGVSEMATTVAEETLISAPANTTPIDSTTATATAVAPTMVDATPAPPAVAPTEAMPVSRSSGS